MEIKVHAAYPIWLSKLLCELEIYPISFSKYGTAYSNSVLSGELWPGRCTEMKKSYINKEENITDRREKEKETCLGVYSVV